MVRKKTAPKKMNVKLGGIFTINNGWDQPTTSANAAAALEQDERNRQREREREKHAKLMKEMEEKNIELNLDDELKEYTELFEFDDRDTSFEPIEGLDDEPAESSLESSTDPSAQKADESGEIQKSNSDTTVEVDSDEEQFQIDEMPQYEVDTVKSESESSPVVAVSVNPNPPMIHIVNKDFMVKKSPQVPENDEIKTEPIPVIPEIQVNETSHPLERANQLDVDQPEQVEVENVNINLNVLQCDEDTNVSSSTQDCDVPMNVEASISEHSIAEINNNKVDTTVMIETSTEQIKYICKDEPTSSSQADTVSESSDDADTESEKLSESQVGLEKSDIDKTEEKSYPLDDSDDVLELNYEFSDDEDEIDEPKHQHKIAEKKSPVQPVATSSQPASHSPKINNPDSNIVRQPSHIPAIPDAEEAKRLFEKNSERIALQSKEAGKAQELKSLFPNVCISYLLGHDCNDHCKKHILPGDEEMGMKIYYMEPAKIIETFQLISSVVRLFKTYLPFMLETFLVKKMKSEVALMIRLSKNLEYEPNYYRIIYNSLLKCIQSETWGPVPALRYILKLYNADDIKAEEAIVELIFELNSEDVLSFMDFFEEMSILKIIPSAYISKMLVLHGKTKNPALNDFLLRQLMKMDNYKDIMNADFLAFSLHQRTLSALNQEREAMALIVARIASL